MKRIASIQFSSVAHSCLTICNPMNCSIQGLPVLYQHLGFIQTHVHRVSDATTSLTRWTWVWMNAISSSVIPFSSCPQSLPASESFPMSQLYARDGQSTGVSALASFLPKKSQDWSPSQWTGWICLQFKGLKSLLQHHSSTASILQRSACFTVQLSHPYMMTGKNIALTRQTFVGKIMSLPFNRLSILVITFLPKSKHHLISWLQSPSAMIFEPSEK